jgi:hypothetical protein
MTPWCWTLRLFFVNCHEKLVSLSDLHLAHLSESSS